MKPWHQRARHALAHSLRVRIVALFLGLGLAMAATFLFGMQHALSIGWRDAARPLVVDYVDQLAAELGSPPDVARAQAMVHRLPLSVRISGPAVNWRSHPAQPYELHGAHEGAPEGGNWGSDAPRFFERVTADGHRIRFGLNVQAWHDRPRFIGWLTLSVLLGLTALAYAGVHHLLRPLADIRAGALRFGRGDFSRAIPVRHAKHPDELGDLTHTINTMGADIQHMLDAKRALLLAISHELRSPLTRARLNTELLPESPPIQPQREALMRDLALMRDMVTDLLESERLTSPHAALHREPTDVAALIAAVVDELQSAGRGAVSIQAGAPMPLIAVDAARVRLLVRNLLDNALRHSPDAALPPVIGLTLRAPHALTLSVRDFGPGVPQEQLPHLAQAFYRTDTARTRESGGVGLGLYLCKLVAVAHGGSFTVRNAHPGLEIEVVLPAAQDANP